MSGLGWKITSAIWSRGVLGGSAMLVLLCLAHRADGSTGTSWPSIGWISDRCRIGPRQVMRHLQSLRASGLIRVAGTHPSGVKMYDLRPVLTAWGGVMDVNTSHLSLVTGGGDMDVSPPCHESREGAASDGTGELSPATPNPSIDPSIDPGRQPLTGKAAFQAWRRQQGRAS